MRNLDQEPKSTVPKITRRKFGIGLTATVGGLFVAGCEATGIPQILRRTSTSTHEPTIPTLNPSETPGVSSTLVPTVETTPTEKPKVTLSEDYLKNGFRAIGGEEIVGTTPEPNNPYKFSNTDELVSYTSDVFDNRERITFQSIAKDSSLIVDIVAAAAGLGSNVNLGVVGLGDVKDQNNRYLFEGLKDWKVWTGVMNKIRDQSSYRLPAEQALPEEFTVYAGTKLTVIGQAGQDRALVLFSEYFDRSSKEFKARKVPRGWYVILPNTLPVNIDGLSLQKLLQSVGADYDAKTNAISFMDGNEKSLWPLPEIIPDLMKKISDTRVGVAWVDQLDDSFCENPLILGLSKEQTQGTQALTLKKNAEGVWEYWGVKVQSKGQELLYQAVWKEERKGWVWQKPGAETSPTEESTKEPTEESTKESTGEPTKEATGEPEGPKEYVTWNTIDGYTAPDGDKIGTVIPGKHFTILEEQGDWVYIALEAGGKGWIKKSDTAYGIVGTQPPEGTPEPSGNFPKEIVLGNGQLVIENMGSKFGINVTQYAERSDGTIAKGSEAVKINSDYVNAMFAKYNTSGKVLKIFFYDDLNKFPYRNEGRVFQDNYNYGREMGNTVELHLGVYQTFDPNNSTRISYQLHLAGIAAFLAGDYNAIIKGSVPGLYPEELDAIAYPGKFFVTG